MVRPLLRWELVSVWCLAVAACGGGAPEAEVDGERESYGTICQNEGGTVDARHYYGYDARYVRSQAVDLDPQRFGACLAHSIATFAMLDEQGRLVTPQWNRHLNRLSTADLTAYLAAVPGTKCQETGEEARLQRWVFAQPENSITPLSFFRAALGIQRGDVFLALLAAHNVLRSEARFFAPYTRRCKGAGDDFWYRKVDPTLDGYYYLSSYPRMNRFFRRMVDIRGDLRERGETFNGDHPGSWYRLFGILLWVVGVTPVEQLARLDDAVLGAVLVAGRAAAWGSETWKKVIGCDERDARKLKLNEDGGAAMVAALSALRGGRTRQMPLPACEPTDYLVPR
ncbi:MAG: hypothetical protein IT371_16290 [Deltaproteobacteria bacterium]|nr:hypothetical protein [Deltaproteobacteria bacterium]